MPFGLVKRLRKKIVNFNRRGVYKYQYFVEEDAEIKKVKKKPFNDPSYFKDVIQDNYDVIQPFKGWIGDEYLDLSLAVPENQQ